MDIREIIKSKYFIISILITPVLFYIAVFATAGGDGTYIPAALFFPYAMLLARFSENILTPSIVIAWLQIPFYGILIAIADRKDERTLLFVKAGIAIVHVIAVALWFVVRSPSF
jgi:hypothetical protein